MVHPSASATDAGPPSERRRLDGSGICLAVTALLGVANLFLGFATVADATDATDSASYFDSRGVWAWFPALLFLAGLTAVRALVSRRPHDRSWPLLITAAAMTPFILSVIKSDHPDGLATGEILYLAFGLLQLIVAATAVVLTMGRITVTTFTIERHKSPVREDSTELPEDAD